MDVEKIAQAEFFMMKTSSKKGVNYNRDKKRISCICTLFHLKIAW